MNAYAFTSIGAPRYRDASVPRFHGDGDVKKNDNKQFANSCYFHTRRDDCPMPDPPGELSQKVIGVIVVEADVTVVAGDLVTPLDGIKNNNFE
jgi:hypothetical protein